jgi:hypothetical protein
VIRKEEKNKTRKKLANRQPAEDYEMLMVLALAHLNLINIGIIIFPYFTEGSIEKTPRFKYCLKATANVQITTRQKSVL